MGLASRQRKKENYEHLKKCLHWNGKDKKENYLRQLLLVYCPTERILVPKVRRSIFLRNIKFLRTLRLKNGELFGQVVLSKHFTIFGTRRRWARIFMFLRTIEGQNLNLWNCQMFRRVWDYVKVLAWIMKKKNLFHNTDASVVANTNIRPSHRLGRHNSNGE